MLKALEFFEKFLITMGEEGVSSDDSDGDIHGAFVRPRKMPWRRKEIERYVEWIDQTAVGGGEGAGKGSGGFPMRRIRDSEARKTSQRPHVNELPECLYDEEWLQENRGRRDVKVGSKNLQWTEVII
jgi:hypothetical protein